MYGPVPKPLRLNGASRDVAPLYFSSACLGTTMPLPPVNGTYQPPVACLKVRRTVVGSTASTLSRSAKEPKVVAAVSLFVTNWYVKTTSSAVNGSPSAHLTPGLSL